ncbi:MAG: hypothetical protein JXR73_21060 [Candidatus Omnitrophica bacterium]|nr:hypothetical protein [Candidatus Omnitrophota bacterium]
MANNTKNTEKNGRSAANGLENGNGARSAAGLVVAGLVTVVGSWIGMAAYMDYRLQGMEDRIATETKQQVVSVVDASRTTLGAQINTFSDGITTKINDTSSVLAKGLLDLTEKQESRHQKTMEAIDQNDANLSLAMNDLKSTALDEIRTSLKSQQESIQNDITQLTAKVEAGNQDISQAVQTISRSTRSSNDAVLAAVQNMKNNLAEMNTGLLAHMDANAQSLQDLINLSNQQRSQELVDLAAQFNLAAEGSNEGAKILSEQLAVLAQRVTTLSDEMVESQNAVQELSVQVPDWKNASQKQILQISETAQSIQKSLSDQVDGLQNKMSEMDKRLNSTSETLMRALYLTSEGMEGTKVEIKSHLENSKQETSAEIRNLVQGLSDVSRQIEMLKENVTTKTAGSQSSSLPFLQTPQFEQLVSSIQTISSKTNSLRDQIDSQVKEVKARTETLLGNESAPDQTGALRDMLLNFTSLADMAGGELDTLLEGLHHVTVMVEDIKGEKITQEADAASAALEGENAAEIGMNPEDRNPQTQKVSMQ